MLAHARDTWGEAGEIVLAAIAANPGDPVNDWTFTPADVPRPPAFIGGWDAWAGRAIRFRPDTSISISVPPEIARHVARLTRSLGLAPSAAAGAVLTVARRLNPDAARYLPGARR